MQNEEIGGTTANDVSDEEESNDETETKSESYSEDEKLNSEMKGTYNEA